VKNGAIRKHGPLKSIAVSIGTRACHLIGALVADRGWKRPFDDRIFLPRPHLVAACSLRFNKRFKTGIF